MSAVHSGRLCAAATLALSGMPPRVRPYAEPWHALTENERRDALANGLQHGASGSTELHDEAPSDQGLDGQGGASDVGDGP